MGQFDFQQSTSPLLAALVDAPQKRQQMEIQLQQAKQQRMSSLLDNIQSVANTARTAQQIQVGNAEQQQQQSQLQGQQNLQGIANEPTQTAPVSSFGFGPTGQQPTFAQTQQGATQPQRMNSALLQAFPSQAGAALVKQQFPDDEALALKKLRQQNLGLDIKTKQDSLDPTSASSVAARKELEASLGVKLPDNIPLSAITKIGTMASAGDRGAAMKEIADVRRQGLELQKQKFLQGSTHVGAAKIEDEKINQAIHLRTLANQRYDPTTDTYHIPPSLHTELVLGLARLTSPTGVISEKQAEELRAKTAKEGLASMYTYITGEPVSGPPQAVIKLFMDSIDRQGQTSEANRNTYVGNAKELLGDSIDPRLKRINLGNSFNDFLSKSPDRGKKASGGFNVDQNAIDAELKRRGL